MIKVIALFSYAKKKIIWDNFGAENLLWKFKNPFFQGFVVAWLETGTVIKNK